MKNLSLHGLLLALGIAGLSAPVVDCRAAATATTENTQRDTARLILKLDDEVQRRFLDTDKGFGISRLDGFSEDHKAHAFKPENLRESALVQELEQAGTRVAIYLGSVGLYGRKPVDWTKPSRLLLRGPIALNPRANTSATDFIEPSRLWDAAAKAFASLKIASSASFSLDDWKFIARPVRANDESCVDCHKRRFWPIGRTPDPDVEAARKTLVHGDPLGVAIYGYRETPASPQKATSDPPLTAEWAAANYPEFELITPKPAPVDPRLLAACTTLKKEDIERELEKSGPHAMVNVSIYMNPIAAQAFRAGQRTYPVDSIIVKEKAGQKDVGEQGKLRIRVDDVTEKLLAITAGSGGMIKRAPGYDPEHGDWEYFYFTDPAKVEHGRLSNCVVCHERAIASDRVYGSWAGR